VAVISGVERGAGGGCSAGVHQWRAPWEPQVGGWVVAVVMVMVMAGRGMLVGLAGCGW